MSSVRYGGIEGTVILIAPDATVDETSGETYFRVLVLPDRPYLGDGPGDLPITPVHAGDHRYPHRPEIGAGLSRQAGLEATPRGLPRALGRAPYGVRYLLVATNTDVPVGGRWFRFVAPPMRSS